MEANTYFECVRLCNNRVKTHRTAHVNHTVHYTHMYIRTWLCSGTCMLPLHSTFSSFQVEIGISAIAISTSLQNCSFTTYNQHTYINTYLLACFTYWQITTHCWRIFLLCVKYVPIADRNSQNQYYFKLANETRPWILPIRSEHLRFHTYIIETTRDIQLSTTV